MSNILEVVYCEYINGDIESIKGKQTKAEYDFMRKYVDPIFEKNKQEGLDMEACFSRALSDSSRQSFEHGFKACSLVLSSCLNGDLLKDDKGDTED